MYDISDTMEREVMYRLANQRNRDGMDVQQFRVNKDSNGDDLIGASSVMGR